MINVLLSRGSDVIVFIAICDLVVQLGSIVL
jgi:hypothetical protein